MSAVPMYREFAYWRIVWRTGLSEIRIFSRAVSRAELLRLFPGRIASAEPTDKPNPKPRLNSDGLAW